MPDEFIPACRYGHGDLEKVSLVTPEGEPRGMVLPTFRALPDLGNLLADGKGFTVVAYRCAKCGYLEFFDDEVGGE